MLYAIVQAGIEFEKAHIEIQRRKDFPDHSRMQERQCWKNCHAEARSYAFPTESAPKEGKQKEGVEFDATGTGQPDGGPPPLFLL